MIDSLVLNFTLQKHWRELTKDEPYKYYGLFFAHDKNDGTITSVAFKFPTFEEMCCDDPYIEKTVTIENNLIYILDMRLYFDENYVPLTTYRIFNSYYPQVEANDCTREKVANLFIKFFSFEKMKQIDVYSTLTKTEKAAARAIYAEIGSEGDISVSKMIQNTGISRPVYNSLLNTLANTHCAEIDAHGVKGKHIKIISPTLLEHLTQD